MQLLPTLTLLALPLLPFTFSHPLSPGSSNPSPLATSFLFPRAPATAGWTIRNFTRNCSDPKSCIYDLGIDNGVDVRPIPCSVVDRFDMPVATNHSFYDFACPLVPAYHISWGWNYPGDFTVMTIVHLPSSERAFFGYEHPNANEKGGKGIAVFKDVGPYFPEHF